MDIAEDLGQLFRNLYCNQGAFSQELKKRLEQREKSPTFIVDLMGVAANPQLQENVRTAACTYFKRISTSLHAREASTQEKSVYLMQLFDMLSGDLPMKLKRIVVTAIEPIIVRKDKENHLRSCFFEAVRHTLTQLAFPLNLRLCEGLALCGQLLMVMRYDQLTLNQLDKMIEPYAELLAVFSELIVSCAGDVSRREKLGKVLEVGYELTSVLKACFRNQDLPRAAVFQRMLHNQRICDTINNILRVQLPENILQLSIIQVAQSKEAQHLNNMKAHLITCLEVFFRCSICTAKRDRTNGKSPYCNPFTACSEQLARTFIQSMMAVFSRVRPDQLLGTSILKCAQQMLVCVSVLVEFSELYELFSHHRDDCLNGFLLFFFDVGNQLKAQFQTEPEQFIDYIYQIMDRGNDYLLNALQKDPECNALHIVAARLLIRMCMYIDGLLPSIVQDCLAELQSDANLKNKHRALIVLGTVSLKATERRQSVRHIYDFFQTALSCSIPATSEDEKIYYCLLFLTLSKYLPAFHRIDESFRQETLSVCIAVLKGNYPPVSNNPAIEIVNLSLMDSMFQLSHNDNSLMEIALECLIQLVRAPYNSKHLYSAILQLVRDYQQLFDRPLLLKACYHVLVQKVCSLLPNVDTPQQNKHSQDTIMSCWMILRQISSNRKLTLQHIVELQLEAELQPTIAALNNPRAIDYDDDLLMIFVRFVQLGRISDIGLSVIAHFPKLLGKYKGSFHNIYPLTVLLLTGGHELLRCHLNYLGNIYQMCRFMLTKHGDKYFCESEQAKALLLLMCLNCEYHEVLDQPYWLDLITFLMDRLSSQNTEYIDRCFLQETLAAALVFSFAMGYQHIHTQSWLSEVMDKILAECRKIDKKFPRRIFSISLCLILKLMTPGSVIEQNFLHLFYLCVSMVTNEKVLKRLKARKGSSDEIVDEDAQSEDVSDQEEAFGIATQQLSGKLRSINEFQLCNETLLFLKNNYAQALQSISQQLDEDTLDKVKTIMRIQMTQNGPREIVRIRRS